MDVIGKCPRLQSIQRVVRDGDRFFEVLVPLDHNDGAEDLLAGLTTIGDPTPRAGANLCATRLSGKLNGVMPKTVPRGNWRTKTARPSAPSIVSARRNSPSRRRDSSEAQRKVPIARVTSSEDAFRGFRSRR